MVDLDATGIKDLSFEIGHEFNNPVLLFAAEKQGKAILSCYVSKNLVATKELNAGTIVRELGSTFKEAAEDNHSTQLQAEKTQKDCKRL